MPAVLRVILAVVALGLSLPAQSTPNVFVPDNQPAVGTCNTIPLGNAAYTYVGRIPASYFAGTGGYINEVFFAPCASATWSAPNILVGLGHLPNPLPPFPFNFPSTTGIGSFQDFTVVWDSAVRGPLSFPGVANAWSPMGFAALGGTGFCWNGVDDVGFFITFQGATGTFTCHRTTTEPYRIYSGAYLAASTSSGGAAGLKMAFEIGSCAGALYELNSPASSFTIDNVVGNAFSPAVRTVPVGTTVTAAFGSTNVGQPFELVIALAPLLPAGGGALATLNGQLLNVTLSAGTILFLNGGAAPSFVVPFPGNFSVPFPAPSFIAQVSAQQLVVDPSHPDGFALSQGAQIDTF